MKYFDKYQGHKPYILGKTNKFDNTIYTFDIETTSYIILDGEVYPAIYYDKLNKKEQERCEKQANMYIWQFGINDDIYYGRTWTELKKFLGKLNKIVPEKKIVFIHNLSFEFQFLCSVFKMDNVMARKSRKVMKASILEYNIELRCSYMMSNCSLEKLPSIYQLPVNKKVGDLDYTKLRHGLTNLTKEELGYCEYDCLVLYEYIKKELITYKKVDNIPITSTGHVRRELKNLVSKDYRYKGVVKRAINTNPHIYNLLVSAFAGGYTHANWTKAGYVIHDVTSFDFTSSYPYCMTAFMYPSCEFKPCKVKRYEEMLTEYAYLIVIKMTNVKTKYFNTFISMSKCKNIINGKYDNGRVMSADELEIVITDIDFRIIHESYEFDYEILEIYYSVYDYLPKKFINFVLDKYVMKTEYKGVKEKELEYQLEKAKFNSLYGMSVTNLIKDNVIYEGGWSETPLSNEEIIDALNLEKKKAFLSFAYGVW